MTRWDGDEVDNSWVRSTTEDAMRDDKGRAGGKPY